MEETKIKKRIKQNDYTITNERQLVLSYLCEERASITYHEVRKVLGLTEDKKKRGQVALNTSLGLVCKFEITGSRKTERYNFISMKEESCPNKELGSKNFFIYAKTRLSEKGIKLTREGVIRTSGNDIGLTSATNYDKILVENGAINITLIQEACYSKQFPNLPTKGYYIYKYLGKDNEILYVGLTTNLLNRDFQHYVFEWEKWYNKAIRIEYSTYDNKTEMVMAEVYFINKFNPQYNIKSKYGDTEVSIAFFDDKEWNSVSLERKDGNKVIRAMEYELGDNKELIDKILNYEIVEGEN